MKVRRDFDTPKRIQKTNAVFYCISVFFFLILLLRSNPSKHISGPSRSHVFLTSTIIIVIIIENSTENRVVFLRVEQMISFCRKNRWIIRLVSLADFAFAAVYTLNRFFFFVLIHFTRPVERHTGVSICLM